ncbi:MAG: hypothetical protein MUF15_04020 [Acidobacteria bacterium]|jgi:hypothetical protein|nr:hypothetical protein [Acidobacteriota bacterium]
METRKKRLELFISFMYNGKKSLLQKDVEVLLNQELSKQDFHNRITKETISDEFKDCLYQLGLNLNWYMYGSGEMFADNEAGQKVIWIC